MSFLGIDTSSAQEPIALDPGEYRIRVIKSELTKSKNSGNMMLAVTLSFPQHPLAKLLNDYFPLPVDSDDEVTKNRKLLRMKSLQECLGIDRCDDAKDLENLEGTAILKVETSDEYGDQNRVAKYIKA